MTIPLLQMKRTKNVKPHPLHFLVLLCDLKPTFWLLTELYKNLHFDSLPALTQSHPIECGLLRICLSLYTRQSFFFFFFKWLWCPASHLFFFFFNLFYWWLCWVLVSVRGLSPVVASRGHSSSRCAGLSLLRPLVAEHRLSNCGSRPSRSAACGIFPDQGSNPCPLHWQADSQPLCHQGSPQGSLWYHESYSSSHSLKYSI